MLKLCLIGAIIAVICCLACIYNLSGTQSRMPGTLYFTFGISGFLGCTVIILKLLGPATERYMEEHPRQTSVAKQIFDRREDGDHSAT